MEHQNTARTHALPRQALLLATLTLISQSVLATPGQSQLATLQSWLNILGGMIITIALMYVALSMAFRKTPFHEISHVFWGGILFGSASLIGGMLVSG